MYHIKIYEIIFDKLINRGNRFTFFTLIKTDVETNIAKVNYGKILVLNYGNLDDLDNIEKAVLDEDKLLDKKK